MLLTNSQLFVDCLQQGIILSGVPDLEFFAVYDFGFATFVHAAEPPAVIKWLPQLLLANAIMLADLHRTATARTARPPFIQYNEPSSTTHYCLRGNEGYLSASLLMRFNI